LTAAGGKDRIGLIRRVVIVAAVVESMVCVAAWVLDNPRSWVAMDYRTFFRASRLSDALLYHGPDYTFVYPPTAIAPLRLLTFTHFWTGYVILGLVSALVFFLATRRLGGSKGALLSLLSLPALQGLIWGQVPMLLTAALLAALALGNDYTKGLVIGLLVALKPQLFVMAFPIFLVRGETRTAVSIVAGAALSIAVSFLLVGSQPWWDWWAAIHHFEAFLIRSNAELGMISPGGIALWAGLPIPPFIVAGLGIAAWLVWQARDEPDPLMLAAIIGGASIMASPYAMKHDAIVLMPAAALCMLRSRIPSAIAAAVSYAGTVVPFAAPAFLFVPFRERASAERKGQAS